MTCVMVVGKASRVSVISDGLRYGKKQVAAEVSQQVDSLAQTGARGWR